MLMLIAFFTMLIDHIGYIFFPHEAIFRIIGRIAFPIFAWGIVRGYKFTRNRNNYLKRLLILAVICQIPFSLAFGLQLDYLNVIFTLFLGLLSICVIEEKKIILEFKLIFLSFFLFLAYFYNTDYSIFGVLSIILFYFFYNNKIGILFYAILVFLFNCVLYSKGSLSIHFNINLFSIIGVFLIYFLNIKKYDFRLNFYFKYLFYPVHLLILYLIYIGITYYF